MDVKGLSINDIMNLSWERLNKLSEKELKQVTSRLVSASNKRLRRLEHTTRGKSSFAYQTVKDRGRDFSVRGKNINQTKQEFKLAKQFLNYKTSTVKGWKVYRENVEERTGYATEGESLNWSERTWKKYWLVYRRFTETYGGTYRRGDSNRIQKMLTEIMESNDKRRKADTFQEMIEDKYKEIIKTKRLTAKNMDDAFSIKNDDETIIE